MMRAGDALDDDIEAGLAQIARTDTSCLIYTSGTGGAPKGRDAQPRRHPV